MFEYRKVFIGLSVLSAGLFMSGCARDEAVWVALINGMPEKIFSAGAGRSALYYVLKQTHEPLFRRDDGQNYTSRVLKKWSRNISNTEFVFCPDTSLRFNANQFFPETFFSKYISGLAMKYGGSAAEVLHKDACFIVHFPGPEAGFLDFLTAYENAPSIKFDEIVEDGLGPFSVDSVGKDKISLVRKIPVDSGYNKIILVEQAAQKTSGITDRSVSDFNRVQASDIPDWVKSKYLGFNTVTLKSGNLIINHPDQDVRDAVYNCIDVKVFRAAFFPARKNFHSIKTVFPVGVPGAMPGEAEQRCSPESLKGLAGRKIVLANWRDDNAAELQKFSISFQKRTGIRLQILNSTPGDLIKILYKKPRPYNLIVLHLDAVRAEQAAFLEVFVGNEGYLDFKLPKVEAMYKQMLVGGNVERSNEIGAKIALELRSAAVVLPLYQDERYFYYPKEIKNINIGRGFIEYPEVADLRW